VLVLEAADAKPKTPSAPVQEKTAAVPAKPAPGPLVGAPAPAAAPARSEPPAPPTRAAEQRPSPSTPADQEAIGKAHASPSVRRLAREFGVDLSQVKGSGPKERILKEDVQSFVKAQLQRPKSAEGGAGIGFNLPPAPQVDFAKFGPVKSQPLSRIKKLSGAFLHRNWLTIPHVTQHEEADITELEAFRKSQADEAKAQGIRFTILGFLMKASVVALKNFPEFNASLAADG